LCAVIFAQYADGDIAAQRRRLAAGGCGDLMVISKTANAVRIDQVRRINEFFSYQAFEAGCRIAVVCDAETMGEAAQNALLKTLEEPAAERIIILLATNTDNLLPTVLSRVQSLNIDGPDINISLGDDEKTFLCDK
jgi:DNA polymerase-3 subunit delta'